MSEVRLSLAEVRRVWEDRSVMLADAAGRLGVHPDTLARRAAMMGLPSRRFKVSDDVVRDVWGDHSLTRAQMEARAGLSASNLWRRARMLGLPARPRTKKSQPPPDRARFAEMWRAGISLAEMGRAFGLHWSSINRWSRRFGLPPRLGGAPRGLTLADWDQMQLCAAMARTAAAEQHAMKERGMMPAPGLAGREAA